MVHGNRKSQPGKGKAETASRFLGPNFIVANTELEEKFGGKLAHTVFLRPLQETSRFQELPLPW